MRNIFLFIRRYFNFLFFAVLQIIALYILFHYNRFHEAAFMGVASEITGRVSDKYNNITYYFNLKKTNEELVKENAELRNRLQANFGTSDTLSREVIDSAKAVNDTTGKIRKFMWRPAKVVYNTVNLQKNTFTIERGSNQGVHDDMGVISPSGVAGVVINTSSNFSIAMSLLHSNMKVSASLKKTGETGSVFWDGISPLYLTMNNVPKSVPVAVGDSIVTSPYGVYRFPQGVMVGTVAAIVEDKSSNFYTLRIKPATNFYNIEYVNVVENMQKAEQQKLEKDPKSNQ